jgi:hypothetical protein
MNTKLYYLLQTLLVAAIVVLVASLFLKLKRPHMVSQSVLATNNVAVGEEVQLDDQTGPAGNALKSAPTNEVVVIQPDPNEATDVPKELVEGAEANPRGIVVQTPVKLSPEKQRQMLRALQAFPDSMLSEKQRALRDALATNQNLEQPK